MMKLGNGHAAEARRAPALESDGPPSVFAGQVSGQRHPCSPDAGCEIRPPPPRKATEGKCGMAAEGAYMIATWCVMGRERRLSEPV